MDCQVSAVPESGHRVSACRGFAALLAAGLAGAPAPATAEEARARLSVNAVVLPACRASAAPQGHFVSCTGDSAPRVRIERQSAPVPSERPAPAPGSTSTTFVTITY